ncbi:TIGR02391 family protein [Sulfurovum sp.]|uniref:TIGR02391 family protein n=1 Tax=Sulfurovum sp. TaxID=1969726 RepID=UPI003564A1D5
MFIKDNFNEENFDQGLVAAVGQRITNGEYTDAILAGTKYLTDMLREKSSSEGDGAQLVGQVLGGHTPKLPLNSLQTVSEKDEQKGIEQLLRGYYIGIRNPRTHEITQDTEEFCIRIMILIDTMLQYINREVEEFDVPDFVNRIYDPHFVASKEYAETLISQVPNDKLIEVFKYAFDRRDDGRIKDIKFAFTAIYQLLPEDDLKSAIECVGESLRVATDNSKIAELFRLLKPSAWQYLQNDVKMRIENMVIESAKVGRYDIYSGIEKGSIGTWGNTFGKYFSRKDDLVAVLLSRLTSDWYTQNYVGEYFMYSLPAMITRDEQMELLAENLSYAALSNQAKIVRSQLLEVCENYPAHLKKLLKVSVQERKNNDSEYAEELLDLLT